MPDTLIEGLPIGVVVHQNGVITEVNTALTKMLGFSAEAMIGKRVTAFMSDEEGRRVLARFEQRRAGDYAPAEYECGVYDAAGERRVLALTIALKGDGAVVLARDVTEQARRRLRTAAMAHLGVSLQHQRSEAAVFKALREGLEQVGLVAAMLVVEDNGLRVRFIQLPATALRRFEASVGVTVDGLVGRWTKTLREALAWGEAYTDDALTELGEFVGGRAGDVAKTSTARAGLLFRGAAVRIDEGSRRSLLVVLGGWLRDDDRPVVQLLGAQVSVALDNARVLALSHKRERDLATLNAVARRMLCGAPETERALVGAACEAVTLALGVLATDALMIKRNEGESETLKVQNIVGGHEFVVAPGSLLEEALRQPGPVVVTDTETDPRAMSLKSGGASESLLLVPLEDREGRRGVLVVRATAPRRFDDDEIALAMAIATVVQVGVENARLYDELRHRVEELTEAHAQLVQSERLAAVGELAATIAHEVRNPLAVMRNCAVVLERVLPDGASDAHTAIKILKEETERLARLVTELLDFVRPLRLSSRPTAVKYLFEEALSVVSASAGAAWAKVTLSINVVPEALEVCVDPRVFRQALVNVMLNAVQAMPEGGALTLGAERRNDGGVALTVSDTGVGISKEHISRVLEPFYTTRATGTGLGLAVTRRVLEAHQGSVRFDSEPGRGTTVTLWVPEQKSVE